MKGFPDLPPIWLGLCMALVFALGRWVPGPQFEAAWLRHLGVAVALMGVGVILWAALWFWRAKTTIEPHHDPKALITDGPFAIWRNPIYLGMLAILAGQILWTGALSPVIVGGIFHQILLRRFIRPKEERLRAVFGEAGAQYIAAVRRW